MAILAEDIVLDSGNGISFNFDTANIGSGVPDGWGSTCAAVVVGAVGGSSFWYQTNTPSTRGFITEMDFLLASSSMEPGKGVTIAISKADGSVFTAERNWRLYIIRTPPGDYKFNFVLGEDDDTIQNWPYPVDGSLSLGQVYKLKIVYDLVNQVVAFLVDDQYVVQVPATDHPQNVSSRVIGSSGSSDGRNIVYLLDNIHWNELPQRIIWRRPRG